MLKNEKFKYASIYLLNNIKFFFKLCLGRAEICQLFYLEAINVTNLAFNEDSKMGSAIFVSLKFEKSQKTQLL